MEKTDAPKEALDKISVAAKGFIMSFEFDYKGYSGSCVASFEDDCLHGRILFIEDLITFKGETFSILEASFKEAVDEYLRRCENTGKPASKPYSGSFNVQVGTDLHRSAAQYAKLKNMSLNELVRSALENELK